MDAYSSFEIPFQYSDQDCYIRAIGLNMIRRNGEIKDSAFKSKKGGVSVTRSNDDLFDYAIAYMKSHFDGVMASFMENVCPVAGIYEQHSPSPGHNHHHWELYGSAEKIELTDDQIDKIIDGIVLHT